MGASPHDWRAMLTEELDKEAMVWSGSGVGVTGAASNWTVTGEFDTVIGASSHAAVALTSTSPGSVDVTRVLAFPSVPVVTDVADNEAWPVAAKWTSTSGNGASHSSTTVTVAVHAATPFATTGSDSELTLN